MEESADVTVYCPVKVKRRVIMIIVLLSDGVQSEGDSDVKEFMLFPISPTKRNLHLPNDLGLHLQVKIWK